MGTFTKSFASAGGYLCADKVIIDHLRENAFSSAADVSMPVPLAQQIISSLSIIMGKDGTNEGKKRLTDLQRNTRFFRTKLAELGFIVIGSYDSPVIPLMIIHPCKMTLFSRMCLEKNVCIIFFHLEKKINFYFFQIAVVMAAYPATEVELSRARFCVSAGHTTEDLEYALEVIKEIGDICMLRFQKDDPLLLSAQ